jgi:hypothetical protein
MDFGPKFRCRMNNDFFHLDTEPIYANQSTSSTSQESCYLPFNIPWSCLSIFKDSSTLAQFRITDNKLIETEMGVLHKFQIPN